MAVSAEHSKSKTPFSEQGKRLKRARERTGVSQENFAPLIGTTRRHLIRLEKGWHKPGRELLLRIAESTGKDADSFGYTDPDDEEEDPSMSLDELLRLHVRRVVEREVARVESAEETKVA